MTLSALEIVKNGARAKGYLPKRGDFMSLSKIQTTHQFRIDVQNKFERRNINHSEN